MKAFLRRPLFAVFCIVFSLLFLIYISLGINERSVLGSPERLIIPAINVNASIEQVGITKTGEMEVPKSTADVGWFKFGSHPGEQGSAVISGHFDGENGEAAVFANLSKLKKGDKLYIKGSKGKTITFVVSKKGTFDPGYADEVFSLSDSAHLNLITCDGVWDDDKKSYTKRLVVFADSSTF